ncbi:hypothetical protein K435DRAFT_871356 [Dendrothele bispora CBS 962.96]|uniref:Uncharacterized protein n=1 Tax=Dendrothele bispora (strain CBS 962.96) TaxID=1314807 RepID=A0A4S8L4W5_DENBC|nr:hypothetical protein K435DRAFT_871356 [Dendrothele bispora CBS 962.96]
MPKRKTRLTLKRPSKKDKFTGAPAPHKPIGSGGSSDAIQATTRKRKRVSNDETNDEEEGTLNYEEHFSKTPPGASWCSGCDDDTVLKKLLCDTCGHIVCYGPPASGACIEICPKAVANPCWASFRCPACELLSHHGNKDLFRYTGFYDQEGNGLVKLILAINNRKFTFFKPVRLEGLAVVQLELDDQNEEFDLAFQFTTLRAAAYASGVVSVEDVLKHSLRNPPSVSATRSSPQPLLKTKIVFDLSTPEGVDQHTRNMNDLVLALDRMGITQIVFLVVTHADPESGDLHYAPNGIAAESLRVIDYLFPTTVRQWLVERSSHLFLLVCGSKPLTQDGYQFMTDLVTRRVFNNSFMFPATHLQPGEVTNFIAFLVERVFYENIPLVPAVMLCLEDLPRLGLHTRMLRLSSTPTPEGRPACQAVRYVWTQSHRRPWGLDAPTFCPTCQCVKSFKTTRTPARNGPIVTFRCLGSADPNKTIPCTKEIAVALSQSEAKLVQGPATKRGAWQSHLFVWDQAIMARF